jgi:hypothetical protein
MYLQNISFDHIKPMSSEDMLNIVRGIVFDERDVLIVIDDFTRPVTPITRMVVEYAISEVGEDRVAVVVASGLHRASTNHEVSEKIGPDLTKRLRIYSHSPLCDFPLNKKTHNIIAVGCVVPHTFAGLSGDAKIIMPGVRSHEATMLFHSYRKNEASSFLRSYKEYVDTYVNYTINSYGDVTRCIVYPSAFGAAEFRAQVYLDNRVYLPDPTDVAVLIPRFKNADFMQSMNAMQVCMDHRIVKDGGYICIHSDTPEGIGVHYGFQQPNGLKPAYYDEVFYKQYQNVEICFICPNLPEAAIQEYFKRNIKNFSSMEMFSSFVEQRLGRTASVAFYHASDIMIGVRE